MNTTLRRVTRVTAPVREQVLGMVRDAIVNGEFPPGSRLIEREICELTGASRPSVREGIRQLEVEGLVTVIPNKGPTVAVLTADEAADIYELRELLEGLATRHFVERASDQQVRELRDTVADVKRALAAGEIGRALDAKNDFYDVLMDGAGSSAVQSTLRLLRNRIKFLRTLSLSQPGRPSETADEVDAILHAIEARNVKEAVRLAQRHVRNAGQMALAVIRETSTD